MQHSRKQYSWPTLVLLAACALLAGSVALILAVLLPVSPILGTRQRSSSFIASNSFSSHVYTMSFAADGNTLLAGCSDGSIWIWHYEEAMAVLASQEHTGFIRSLAVSSDMRLAASGDTHGSILLWRLDGGDSFANLARIARVQCSRSAGCVRKEELAAEGASEDVEATRWLVVDALAFDENAGTLLFATADGLLGAWSLMDDIRTLGVVERVNELTPSSTNGRIVVSGGSAWISEVDPESNCRAVATCRSSTWERIHAISSVGTFLVADDRGGLYSSSLWSKCELQPIGIPGTFVTAACLSYDGQLAVTAQPLQRDGRSGGVLHDCVANRICVWNTISGELVQEYYYPGRRKIYSIAIAPTGRLFACSESGKSVSVWRIDELRD